MYDYEIIPLRQEWLEQASAALNRLNTYLFACGVYGPEQTSPPFCNSAKFSEDLAKGHVFGFVAVDQNMHELAGLLTYSLISDPAFDNGIFPFISNIWVEKDHRGQGVGRRLTFTVTEKENTKHLVLVCGERNPFRQTFVGWGFKETSLHFMSLGQTKNYGGEEGI